MIEKKIKILLVAVGIAITMSILSWSGLGSFADADKDGVTDSIDNCPNISNPIQSDFDGDKIGDECDIDDDNDGVIDKVDVFDYDPTEWADFDKDGIGDNADTDDDNDGIVDIIDAFDYDPTEWADFDFDGIGSNKDKDDDNDGILDINDPTPTPASEILIIKYENRIDDCFELEGTSRLLCYGDFFDLLIKNENSNADALDLALSLSKIGVLDDCHFVSHEIGRSAFEESPNVTNILAGMDSSKCRGGYYHGVLAAYFHDIRESGEEIGSSYQKICDGLIGTVDYLSCLHGLGHGLVHYYPDDIEIVIEKCNELSFFLGYQCNTGAFMQHADSILATQSTDTNSIQSICPDTLTTYDSALCLMQIGTAIAFHTGHDQEKGESLCKLLNDPESINYCYEGLITELDTATNELIDPITREDRAIIYPFWIKQDPNWAISVVTKSGVSNFSYNSEKIIFDIDDNNPFVIFSPKHILDETIQVSIDGIEIDWELLPLRNPQYSAIKVTPINQGNVIISDVE